MITSDTTNLAAIEVRHLSKVFRTYRNPAEVIKGAFGRQVQANEFRALDSINLTVERGQSIGIVGRNGAGKSTLLKIIAGTLAPTNGEVYVRGKLSAILELGSGFHPEFTGRQNVYTGGMCLGLNKAEVDERFSSIVEFSGLASVIDQPFRTYSTGMQARLSFSVAVAIDPDILIVDEALSVGDARFQLQCFKRFRELRECGTTILLVSHNMNSVTTLCDRAVLIEQGKLIEDGIPKHIDIQYHRLLFGTETSSISLASSGTERTGLEVATDRDTDDNSRHRNKATFGTVDAKSMTSFGNGLAVITQCGLLSSDADEVRRVMSGDKAKLYLRFIAREAVSDLVVGFLIRSTKGVDLFGVDTQTDVLSELQEVRANEPWVVEADITMWLAAGDYFITFAIAQPDGTKCDIRYDEVHFTVADDNRAYKTSIVNLDHYLSARREI